MSGPGRRSEGDDRYDRAMAPGGPADEVSAIDALTVPVEATIRRAMEVIDRGACEIALATDDAGVLVGTVSDGDVRRALLAGAQLDDVLKPHLNPAPLVVRPDEARATVIDLMQAHRIAEVPVVDDDGRLVGLHLLSRLIGRVERPNLAVVMAGGRGTRLAPLTDHVPKPMLEVAGRPILERILLHLVGAGITEVAVSVNHLREQIEDHFGDGRTLGCRITYLREEPDLPLGTAGSLSLLEGAGLAPADPVVVMNGDLVTQFDLAALLDFHADGDAAITVAAQRYRHDIPFGVLEVDDRGDVAAIAEKPSAEWWTNAGIYVLEPTVLAAVPPGQHHDLPQLIAEHLAAGERVGLWPLDEDWHDVGRPEDLRRARGLR